MTGYARCTFSLALLGLCACHGPLSTPMVQRLDDEQQARVDDAWHNLLWDVQQHDRALLLDVLMFRQFYQRGVDTLEMTSTKRVGDRLVVLRVVYDHAVPEDDAFTVTVYDAHDEVLRDEHYTREDVDEAIEFRTVCASAQTTIRELEQRDPATLGTEERERLADAYAIMPECEAWDIAYRLATAPPGTRALELELRPNPIDPLDAGWLPAPPPASPDE